MSFTQPCFIRKNTPELRKMLDKLGYKPFGMVERGFGLSTDELLGEYESFDDSGLENILKVSGTEDNKETIDCGDNEELFIALAALRDDFNENQWFIMDIEAYNHIYKGEWFLSTNSQGGKHVGTQIEPLYCHKATVEELIEHFKTKKIMEDFVPFKIAQKLKEKGFNELCLAYYTKDSNFYYNAGYGSNVETAFKSFNSRPNHMCGKRIDAPTISQVLKWLREKKEIDIVIYPIDANTVLMSGEKYILSVYFNKKRDYKLHRDNIDKYRVWELAALAGIEYVLNHIKLAIY